MLHSDVTRFDAPSVLTAATVGATYSYSLIWFFLLLIVPLFVIQEASGRVKRR